MTVLPFASWVKNVKKMNNISIIVFIVNRSFIGKKIIEKKNLLKINCLMTVYKIENAFNKLRKCKKIFFFKFFQLN
jgi:hypothetical protein